MGAICTPCTPLTLPLIVCCLVDGNNAINVLKRPEMKWYQGLKPLHDHNFLPMKSKQCAITALADFQFVQRVVKRLARVFYAAKGGF